MYPLRRREPIGITGSDCSLNNSLCISRHTGRKTIHGISNYSDGSTHQKGVYGKLDISDKTDSEAHTTVFVIVGQNMSTIEVKKVRAVCFIVCST